MLSPWQLPGSARIGSKEYRIHADYRDILEIFSYLEDPDLPEYIRWKIALALFYEGNILPHDEQEALSYLCDFINCGARDVPPTAVKLIDWEQDAQSIVADINKVAGQEIRSIPFVHWWTFVSWFHAIGDGQLSALVTIRSKLQKAEKLDAWEKTFYRENKSRVDIKKRCSKQEKAQMQMLLQQLDAN